MADLRRQALAGQDFAGPDEIAYATRVATAQLNARARPWIWGTTRAQAALLPQALYMHHLRNVALGNTPDSIGDGHPRYRSGGFYGPAGDGQMSW